jgi:molybdopterin-guanine dinucleotide biosynthesis protein A
VHDSALILAGGKATRLGGIDKTSLVVDGETIFARQVAVLAPRVAEIIVSAPRPVPGYRTVADAVPDGGPLAGIAAGLGVARTEWLLVLAGDMPRITGPVIDLLLSAIRTDVDAVGVRVGELYEPLICVLRVATALPIVRARLVAHRYAAQRLLTDGDLRVHWIDETSLRAVDPELRALTNVNTPEDL